MTQGDYSVSSELFERMPAYDKTLFAEPGRALFNSLLWYTTIARHAIPEKWHARCIVVRRDGVPQLALPVWCDQHGDIKGSLSSHYSVTYRPLFASGVKEREAAQAFARFCERYDVFRFDELDADDAGFAAMKRELQDAKFWSLEFRHFGNWHQPIAGVSFSEYLANRPGVLRSTIERKSRTLHKRARVEWIRDRHDLERGIGLFHEIYEKSWKKKEPFFDIHGALIRAFASCGVLRLALLFVDNRAVAGQIWTVSGGVALLHKLAHEEAAGALSPGTALTALAIRSLMEDNALIELDFGRGDDHYKRLWATQRRQRGGVVFANSRYPRGWMQYGVGLLAKQKRRLWKQNAQEDVAA
jgi:CelD/BcsL family acetyltransferase involved in cellulose biosynthesis